MIFAGKIIIKKIIFVFLILPLSLPVFSQQKNFEKWAPAPPMGWNSYDAYYGCITESQFKNEVNVLAKKLLPYGYEYAVVDYCWFNPGPKGWNPDNWITFDVGKAYGDNNFGGMAIDKYGRLLPALNRFPSAANGKGFKPLADYVHSKGMKFGIHVMRGISREAVEKNMPVYGTNFHAKDIVSYTDSCRWNASMYGVDATKPGAAAYYQSLLNLYASWGVDFIKVDDILSPIYHKGEIELIRKAIDKCGRKIVLSLSPGDALMGYAKHVDNNANMYRMANDVWDRWEDILHIFDMTNDWSSFIGNGSWPDADMIPIGKLCLTGYPEAHTNPNAEKREHFSFLSYDEQKTFMTLWCMARSPLMWGGSALYSSDSAFAVLTNKDILHIQKNSFNNHQVYMTNYGQRAFNKDYRIWVAEDATSQIKYVALFNLKDVMANITFNTQWELWKGKFKGTELWTKEITNVNKDVLAGENIPPHGVKVFKLEPYK